MNQLLTALLLVFLFQLSPAQVDIQCSGRDQHSLYLLSNNHKILRIDNIDSSQPSDTIEVAYDSLLANGMSINNNLNDIPGETTMYLADSFYHYWNGTAWINTGFTSGALNPGGGSKYIFSLDVAAGKVYRYNGTANATVLVSGLNTNPNAVYDVAVDRLDNFYLFYPNDNRVDVYNEDGVLIRTYTTSGNPTELTPGVGLAIVGTHLYWVENTPALYEGTVNGNHISFVKKMNLPVLCKDAAACPAAGEPLAVNGVELPSFAIYPNPAGSLVTIAVDNMTAIEITDYMGRRKLQVATGNVSQYTIPVAAWVPGIYFATVTSAIGQVVRGTMVVM